MNKQSGFAIIAATFILVIVGLLGSYLVNVSAVHHKTTLLALQSARAYHAAKAGVEWGIINVCNSGSFSINNFTVTITANPDTGNPYNENDYDAAGLSVDINICRITSKAEYDTYGDIDYVSRTLEVTLHH